MKGAVEGKRDEGMTEREKGRKSLTASNTTIPTTIAFNSCCVLELSNNFIRTRDFFPEHGSDIWCGFGERTDARTLDKCISEC